MNKKKPTYEELEKKLADARVLIGSLQGAVEAVKSERDAALLGSRDLEEAYIESEENFRNSVDASPLGIRIVTENGETIYANQATLDIFGYRTLDELKKIPSEQLYTPESLAERRERIKNRQRGRFVPPDYEISIRRPDGEERYLHVFRSTVIWSGEQQFMAMYQDITERKKAEETLKESEERHRTIFELSPIGITTLDLKGVVTACNPAVYREGGYSEADIVGKHFSKLTPIRVKDIPKYTVALASILKGDIPQLFVVEYTRKDGSNGWSEVHIGMLKTQGKTTGIQVVQRDITERKRAEEALKESEKNNHLLADYYKRLNNISITFNEAFDTADLFEKIAESFRFLTGARATSFSAYDQEARVLKVMSLSIDPISRDGVISMLGTDLFKMRIPVSTDDIEQMLTQGIRRPKDLHELSSGEIPKDISDSVMDSIECQQIVALAISYAGEIMGTCVAYLRGDQAVVPDEALKTYIYLSGLAIKRKRAEEALRESEEKFSKAFSASGNAICITSLDDSRFLEINESFTRFTGYTREEVIGHSPAELELWVKPEEEKRWLDAIRKEGRAYNHEFSSRNKSGEIRIGLASAEVINIGGEPCRIVAITDITERKQTENEYRYKAVLLDSISDAVIATGLEFNIQSWNSAAEKMYGWQAGEVIGKLMGQVVPTTYITDTGKNVLAQFQKEGFWQGEVIQKHKDGSDINILASVNLVKNADGQPISVLAINRDITERKRAEEALKRSEENFRHSLDDSPLGIRIIDSSSENLYSNRALLDIFGYVSIEEFRSIPAEKRFTPEAYKEYQIRREKLAGGEPLPQQVEMSIVRKDGEIRHLETLRKEILWNGEIQYLVLYQDITGRKKAEERINHLNLTLRSVRNINQLITREKNRDQLIKSVCNILVESRSCDDAWIALFDESRKLTDWAESGLRVDFSPMLEMFNQGKLPPCAQKAMKQKRVVVTEDPSTMCTGCPIATDSLVAGGMTVRLQHEGKIYGILCAGFLKTLLADKDEIKLFQEAAADITFALYNIELEAERDLLMQERLRAAKLESIGTLAGGIAHDFNNFLTGIMGNIGLAKTYLKPDDRPYEMIDEAEKAAVRARDLTQQLLTFARGGKPVKKLVNVAELIKESATFALRGSNVSLELSLPGDLWPVEADEGQISQVIQNLVINADEAMPTGGILSIEAGNFAIRKTGGLPLSGGNYVRIDIKDTGVGISEEHLQRIFEPYFTTKQKGSGMGLTTVYSIVKNHGGYILAESVLNEGSTFRIYLPAKKKTLKTEKKSVVTAPGRAGGKVLVMDDQESIRKMLKNMLDLAGYEPELTRNGAEALEKYAQAMQSGKPFSAVIMDLTIPGGMGGKEAIKKLLEIDPDARVIVSSGYATDPIMSEYKKHGFSAVITKPYSVKQLEVTLLGLSKRKKKR